MQTRCSTGIVRQVGSGESVGLFLPSFLQLVVSGSKNWEQVKTHFGPQSVKP